MPRKPDPVDLRLLSKVSKLYYDHKLTQQAIADRLRLSRPKVSRLIQQAHDEGIVQITVLTPPGSFTELEQALEERFGLDEAVVVEIDPTTSQEMASNRIGVEAAHYLQRTIQDDDVLGVFWGVTLNSMVNALQRCDVSGVHVVQVVGGLGPPEAAEHATDLCRRIARQLNASLTLLPVSGIVDSPQVKAALFTDSHVRNALARFKNLTVAYLGIGAAAPESWIMKNQVLSQEELDALRAANAVGETGLRFFDAQGQPVSSDFDERVIGISLDEIRQIERVIAMAGGPEKYPAVQAALAGRFINVLITDNLLAEALLRAPKR